MFLEPTPTYYRGTEQCAPRARFLLLLQHKDAKCAPGNVYAVVRRVALRQCGHWMMGRANLCGRWVTISGAYGHDGNTLDVDSIPSDAVLLPPDLFDKWNHGGGWNGAGSEADAMREWANATFD